MRATVAAALLLALVVIGALCSPVRAQTMSPTAAVALFYAPTPVGASVGVVPEEYASDRLSTRLAAVSAGRLTVVQRAQVKIHESALRWQEADALRFARLQELAHATGAGRLVVGRIKQLTLDHLGGGPDDFNIGGPRGAGFTIGTVIIEIQVFDAAQGRVVYQTEVTGQGVGGVTVQVLQDMLNDAVARAAAVLIDPLTAASAVPIP